VGDEKGEMAVEEQRAKEDAVANRRPRARRRRLEPPLQNFGQVNGKLTTDAGKEAVEDLSRYHHAWTCLLLQALQGGLSSVQFFGSGARSGGNVVHDTVVVIARCVDVNGRRCTRRTLPVQYNLSVLWRVVSF
jgi:hypothetical protein